MHAYSHAFKQRQRRQRFRGASLRPWRVRRARAIFTVRGDYVYAVPTDYGVRRAAFADFIRRAVSNAQARGMSVPEIARRAAISNSTIYRWLNNVGAKMPSPEQIEAFCDVLDIPPARAFEILWPGKTGEAQPTPPAELPPEMAAIARKLEDPAVPEQEKYHLRESLQQLAARPARPAGARVVRRARR